jgi:hypothetical protein
MFRNTFFVLLSRSQISGLGYSRQIYKRLIIPEWHFSTAK